MATQLGIIKNRLLNPTVSFVRNFSRVPSIFWEDPFRRHRRLLSELWNAPFDTMAPIDKYMGYRLPSMNFYCEDEKFASNPKDGFQVSLNVENFAPNEINVKVIDKSILIEAKHEERAENGQSYVSRHFTRRFVLPEEYNVKDIVSTLSSDGILTVRAPPKEIDPKSVRNIQIQATGPARNPGQSMGPGQITGSGPEQNPNVEMNQNPNETKK